MKQQKSQNFLKSSRSGVFVTTIASGFGTERKTCLKEYVRFYIYVYTLR